MKSEQGELKFFATFPSKETLRLLLEWHALYEELQLEKKMFLSLNSKENLGLVIKKMMKHQNQCF